MKRLCCLLVVVVAVLASCDKKTHAYSVSAADPFALSVVDSIDAIYGCNLDSVLSAGKPTLLYVCSNECSECVSAFVDFNANVCSKRELPVNVVYWVWGCDFYSFEYYMEQNDISMRHNEWLVMDTLDVLHGLVHDFYSNTLFLVNSDKTVSRLVFDSPECEWDLEGFLNENRPVGHDDRQ